MKLNTEAVLCLMEGILCPSNSASEKQLISFRAAALKVCQSIVKQTLCVAGREPWQQFVSAKYPTSHKGPNQLQSFASCLHLTNFHKTIMPIYLVNCLPFFSLVLKGFIGAFEDGPTTSGNVSQRTQMLCCWPHRNPSDPSADVLIAGEKKTKRPASMQDLNASSGNYAGINC